MTGVFYTPSDVARHLALGALAGRQFISGQWTPRCVDPACGTGMLIRAILDELVVTRDIQDPSERVLLATKALHGMDTDTIALDVACFALLARCASGLALPDYQPIGDWRRIRSNFVTVDSISLGSREGANRIEVQLSLDPCTGAWSEQRRALSGFDVLVCNPPFAFVGEARPRTRIAFVPFVRMMWQLTAQDGTAAIVVPLSIACSTRDEVVHVRQELLALRGALSLAFFDRAPDSLFGDDVKTRCAVICINRGAPAADSHLRTTSLRRWTSATRAQALSEPAFASYPRSLALSSPAIPKLGSALEVAVFDALIAERTTLGPHVVSASRLPSDDLSGGHRSGHQLLAASTAYNFLAVRPIAAATDVLGVGSTSWVLQFASSDEKWAAFALLCSTLTFWLWRVVGDGFHVTRRFLLDLPVGSGVNDPTMSELGLSLWNRMSRLPIKSVNKGVVTIAYSPLPARDVLGQVDRRLAQLCGIPSEFVPFASEYQRALVLAGRLGHKRLSHHFHGTAIPEGRQS